MAREPSNDIGCPFYKRTKEGNILCCELGSLHWPDRESRTECLKCVCVNDEGYKTCTFYKILERYYDRLYSTK